MRAAWVLLAGLLLPLLAGCTTPGREVGPLVGNTAPDVALQPLEGPAFRLSEQRGKVVMLDLMGVNCPPCRREMPLLVQFHQAHASDPDLVVVSVDEGSIFPALGARDAQQIRDFQAEFNATWPFAPDARGEVGRAFDLLILPTKVVVDAEGVIRVKLSKEIVSVQELEQALAKGRAGGAA